MADSSVKKINGDASALETSPAALPVPGAFKVVGLEPDAEVYIPVIGRQVIVRDLQPSQLLQLHELGFPHVVRA